MIAVERRRKSSFSGERGEGMFVIYILSLCVCICEVLSRFSTVRFWSNSVKISENHILRVTQGKFFSRMK